MALFTPSESPAVVVKEIDLTGGVPNVQSTTGAIVISSRWGPAEERKLIANETELIDTFASPDSSTTFMFHEASMFLKYSSNLQTVRIAPNAENAFSSTTFSLLFSNKSFNALQPNLLDLRLISIPIALALIADSTCTFSYSKS